MLRFNRIKTILLENHDSISRRLTILGKTCLVLACGLFLITFYPVITAELIYVLLGDQPGRVVAVAPQDTEAKSKKRTIVAKDPNFGIVIPKIGANASVVPDVDPYNSREYQPALTKGVAHALGTVYPGQVGNTFIFSHSSANFYEANRYNSVFYLLHKLDQNDEIYLTYNEQLYKYFITAKHIVSATDVTYLEEQIFGKKLTLMTCWPPGTTLKRLVLEAELNEVVAP